MWGFATRSALATAVAVGALSVAGAPAQAEVPAPVRDGLTVQTPAASCWEIKQTRPDSPTGVYWLQTPQLGAPEQFYCDMTTDGGGWVLIGRGRESWQWRNPGLGTPAEVRNTPAGTGAFKAAALPASTVDGLLGGGRVDALTEGVRLRRAADSAGSQWQEVRLDYKSRDRWSWQFEALHDLDSCQFDGTTYTPATRTTSDCNVTNGRTRLFTYGWASHAFKLGFSYGSAVTGSNSATSFLWQNTTEGHAIPFTQVFVRPRLMSSGLNYSSLPDSGLPAKALPARVSNQTSPDTPWGVTGLLGNPANELDTEVQALRQIGNTMYVGGHFEYVQKGANPGPGEKVRQPYLAGFDVNTGEWLSSFRPVLNDNVWDIIELPNGQVGVAGSFKSVNGDPAFAGLVSLDPATGQVTPGWGLRVENRSTTASRQLEVRSLDVQNGRLYLGGDFTHIVDWRNKTAAGADTVQSVNRLGRLWTDRMLVDWRWRPNLNGSVIDLDVSSRGDNVYIAGYFLTVNGAAMRNAGILSTADGAAAVPGQAPFVPSRAASKTYQQAILETGGNVWVGGSEHNTWMNDRDTFALKRGNITMSGGDTQAMTASNGVIYVGGHFQNNMYQDATTYSDPRPFKQADGVKWLAAFDASTGEYLTDFLPSIDSSRSRGPWALTADTNGCVWFGADFTSGAWRDGANQWLGNFGKLCPRDSTPPATPGNLKVATPGSGIGEVSWDQVPDAARYELFENDRIVSSTAATSATVVLPTDRAGRFFVRAIDAEGNRSATTNVVRTARAKELVSADQQWAWRYGVTEAPAAGPVTLVDADQRWQWRHEGTAPAANWNQPGFDATSWSSGTGEFGFGDSDETTLIPAGSTPRPLSAQFRTSFQVSDPGALESVTLDLVRDDGAVVFLNGQEVARSNMPSTGAIAWDTAASTGISTRTEETRHHQLTIPSSALVAGENTLAIGVHQSDRWSGDLSMRATLAATPVPVPVVPWSDPAFDDSAWNKGKGHFGFGDGDESVVIGTPGTASAQFRTTFDVSDPSEVKELVLNLVRDDGVVVYLNGQEVVRDNLPAGAIGNGTAATTGVWGADESAVKPFVIDPSLLVTGSNTLAVSVHNDWAGGADLSFAVPSLSETLD